MVRAPSPMNVGADVIPVPHEAQEIVSTIKSLLGDDPDRYAGLKQHIRSVHGYVSGNLMLGFIAEVRKVAEQGN